MEYLIRFAQVHEDFRLAEIQAIATAQNIDLTIVSYSDDSPICIVKLPSEDAARRLAKRSILIQNIYEYWGSGTTLPELHESVRTRTSHLWPQYESCSFRFDVECYQATRPNKQRVEIIESFRFLPFNGPIIMSKPDQTWTVIELWELPEPSKEILAPLSMYLGRFIGSSSRDLIKKYDLKKRTYIATTSMEAELSLVTANLALADKGKLFYDPFVGTGSFPVACANFGAICWGSDIDGRSIRGKGGKKTLKANFEQYGLLSGLGGFFAADLTNNPFAKRRLWDGIVCDIPYGVREGLKVLGLKDPEKTPWLVEKGKTHLKDPDYNPPKKPYGLVAIIDDLLAFAARSLVDDGRLCFWMPTANDEDQELPIPYHPCLELVSSCKQVFTKWSRRLMVYRRLRDDEIDQKALEDFSAREAAAPVGVSVDELNPFRRRYFAAFRDEQASEPTTDSATNT